MLDVLEHDLLRNYTLDNRTDGYFRLVRCEIGFDVC